MFEDGGTNITDPGDLPLLNLELGEEREDYHFVRGCHDVNYVIAHAKVCGVPVPPPQPTRKKSTEVAVPEKVCKSAWGYYVSSPNCFLDINGDYPYGWTNGPVSFYNGDVTMDLLLSTAPSFLHPFGRLAAESMMDQRLTRAMGYDDANLTLRAVLEAVFQVRKFCLRYLALPRLISARRSPFVSPGGGNALCPRYHIYQKVYPHGYQTANLGTAPKGKLMKECPMWKK